MDWMRRQDVKEEPQEAAPNALTPEDDDECYFEEDASIDEGMVREISPIQLVVFQRFDDRFARDCSAQAPGEVCSSSPRNRQRFRVFTGNLAHVRE